MIVLVCLILLLLLICDHFKFYINFEIEYMKWFVAIAYILIKIAAVCTYQG